MFDDFSERFFGHFTDVVLLYVAYNTKYLEEYEKRYTTTIETYFLYTWKTIAEFIVLWLLINKGN